MEKSLEFKGCAKLWKKKSYKGRPPTIVAMGPPSFSFLIIFSLYVLIPYRYNNNGNQSYCHHRQELNSLHSLENGGERRVNVFVEWPTIKTVMVAIATTRAQVRKA
jgi:hypothetical protein